MTNYRRINFDVKDVESYITRKLREGCAIIQVSINELNQEVDELISYANASEEESWYRCYLSKGMNLKDYVIIQNLSPCYERKNESDLFVDINSDYQNILGFHDVCNDLAGMKKYYLGEQFERNNVKHHYEWYISRGKCDIGNFGASMELDFLKQLDHEKDFKLKL